VRLRNGDSSQERNSTMTTSQVSVSDRPEPLTQQQWRASCEACGWTQTAGTYTDAGTLARAHADECPEAATLVEAV